MGANLSLYPFPCTAERGKAVHSDSLPSGKASTPRASIVIVIAGERDGVRVGIGWKEWVSLSR